MLPYVLRLLVTIAVEGLVVLGAANTARRRTLATCACLNLFTHPLATLLLIEPRLSPGPLLIEILVVAAEAIGYCLVAGLSAGRAVALSLLANVASVAAGWLWYAVA